MRNSLWIIAVVFIGVGFLLLASKRLLRRLNRNFPERRRKVGVFRPAVIIPAREESAVISGLMEALAAQTEAVPFSDVYVIVERRDDPTVKIVKNYGARAIARKDIKGRERKGYALAEAVEKILRSGKRYDAYFIFDADNVPERRFIERMRKVYERGYDIGIGRRLVKNPETAMAIGSGLIFTIINEVLNRGKTKNGMTCICSGTGFYIAGEVIERLGTYPFYSLTEDYELSIYAAMEGLTTYYERGAEFYDAQPREYRQYFRQRTRWVKGYFEARRNFRGQMWQKLSFKNPNFASVYSSLVGIYDLVLILIGILMLAIFVIFGGEMVMFNLFGLMLAVYIILAVASFWLLGLEKYKLDSKMRLKVILLNPLLLASYVPCLIAAICSPELKWKRIEH